MAKVKKKIVMNEARLRQMGGELFSDLDYKLNRGRIAKTEHRRRSTERHVKFLDMLPFKRQDPVKWIDDSIRNLGRDKVKQILRESLECLKLSTIYNDTKVGKRNLIFYKNANGYFRHKYLGIPKTRKEEKKNADIGN